VEKAAKMKQLSGLDAGFLSLETPTTPMTIGSLSILDPRTASGRLDIDSFRAFLASRLEDAPVLRRRLASLPLDLSRPYWVELAAGQVDLGFHVEKTQLPEPGSWHELAELVAWELARPLDRSRPLWQVVFVEGLEAVEGVPAGSVALIARVHHAAVDGVSGAEILGALAEATAGRVAKGQESAPTQPAPGIDLAGAELTEPGVLDLLTQAGRDLAAAPPTISRALGRSLLGLARSVRQRANRRGEAGDTGSGAGDRFGAPPLPFSAPRTPFNRALSAQRSWAPAFFDLDQIKAIKTREDATVNDVVLAVCAGALRGWLAEVGELPAEPLVAMVPVSVRGEAEMQSAGNLVSAMLVSLATDEPDAKERLRKIRDAARSSKVAHQAVGARTLVESARLVPFALSGLGVRLYSRLHLAEKHRPMCNLVITNVPGPPQPLSIAGVRMLTYAPAAPLFDGLGLILPVFSYAGTVSIGVTADRKIMPDAAGFASRLEGAIEELR
jgi:WS/DGAT/MGAT family acyltransferase